MELRVSSYGSRAALEAYCERLDPEQKTGVVIIGTTEELLRFQLSNSTTVYDIPCKATDFTSSESINAVPERITSNTGYGLDNQLIKPKE